MIPEKVIAWLVESKDPSIKFRTLVELLDRPRDDEQVIKAKNRIASSEPVKSVIGEMHPEGYWLQRNPRSGEILGDDVKYGAFATTHFCLSYLAELGMDKNHPKVAKAAERYISLQKPDGDFYRHFSCLLGYNIRTFLMLGYRNNRLVKRSIDLLLRTKRADGGYLCEIHEGKYKTKSAKSCIRGSVKVLLAFSRLPEYWDNERIQELLEYFLSRGGIYKKANMNEFVNKDMQVNSFPIIWRANVFEILLALSRMGYGDDERLKRAWKVLDSKIDGEGRYLMDWTPIQCPWKVGKRGEPNKWTTFYSYLAKNFKETSPKIIF